MSTKPQVDVERPRFEAAMLTEGRSIARAPLESGGEYLSVEERWQGWLTCCHASAITGATPPLPQPDVEGRSGEAGYSAGLVEQIRGDAIALDRRARRGRPAAWMRDCRTLCTTAESKRKMETAGFGKWGEAAKLYTVPLYLEAEDLVRTECLNCDTCNDTGQICVGHSGQESDGNAPLLETCPDCGFAESPGATDSAIPDEVLAAQSGGAA